VGNAFTRGRHVFVVHFRDVFAYRFRVLEAATANSAMPLVAGEGVRTPLGAFRVLLGHFQILRLLLRTSSPIGSHLLLSDESTDHEPISPPYRRPATALHGPYDFEHGPNHDGTYIVKFETTRYVNDKPSVRRAIEPLHCQRDQ
jgi:hypothetical protein